MGAGRIRVLRLLAIAALSWACVPQRAKAQQERVPERVVVVPVYTRGVDPGVARFVARGMRNALERRGYAIVPAETAVPGDQPSASASATAPSLRELWETVHRRDAQYAVAAQVSALHGRYVVEITVAVRDGRGPWFGKVDAGNAELEAEAGELAVEVVEINARGVEAGVRAEAGASADAGERARAGAGARAGDAAMGRDLGPRLRLALRDELVMGMDRDHFAGALLGARADYLMGPSLYLGAYLGYANLPGYEQRAQTALWYAQLEHRNRISERFGVPLRIGLGYLLRNGAVLRLSAGVALRLARRLELVLDVIAPSFWVTPDTTLFSLDPGIELGVVL